MDFLTDLQHVLHRHADLQTAAPMSAYMKNRFPYLGIRNEKRKALLKPVWQKHEAEIRRDFREIIFGLLALEQREFHYCAMDIFRKEINGKFEKDDIALIERWITTKSWWDSVDFLARHALGNYLLAFPSEIPEVTGRFSDSDNLWLNRCAILFQLGYKGATDEKMLFAQCEKHGASKEFFIRKAIGWALREYAKTRPEAVRDFVAKAGISPLSKREALKNL